MKQLTCILLAFTTVLSIQFIGVESQAKGAERLGPFVKPPKSVRSRDFDQRHLRIELGLDWDKETINGRVVHNLVPFKPLTKLSFDAAKMQIQRVERLPEGEDQKPVELKFRHKGTKLSVTLDKEAKPDKPLTIAIKYVVKKPSKGGYFVVPDKTEPDQPKTFWTQCQPEDAKYWFPCHDSPADRITSETIITVPENYYVLSNGTLKSTSKPKGGLKTYHWEQKQTHVPYLVSVVAGEFDSYEQSWDGIPVISYVPKGRLEEAKVCFSRTPEMLKLFSEKIGYRYPWPKYTQICVDEYVSGGMEHTSATTLTLATLHDAKTEQDRSSIDLVAHELAHQWWGDLITCKDWGEIWLNESFATYFETVWTEHDLGKDEAIWKRHEDAESYKTEDRTRYRRPLVTYRYPHPWAMFDRHTYPKGSCIINMLRHTLGDRLFWNGIQRYVHDNQYTVVETADLRKSFENATGHGLNWFFDQWVHKGGHPDYKVSYTYDDRSRMVQLTILQTQRVDSVTPLFEMPIDIEIVTASERIKKRIRVSQKKEVFSISVPQSPERVLFDPEDWVLKTLNFQKSKQEWIDQLLNEEHIMCRYRAAKALKRFDKDEEVLMALAKAASTDNFWAVRREAILSIKKFAGKEVEKVLIKSASSDKKSFVRRAAIAALGDVKTDGSRKALRAVIKADSSYYAVAAALTALVSADPKNCKEDIRTALDRRSDREVIMEAAAKGLAAIEDYDILPVFLELFETPSPFAQRGAVLSAIAKLGKGDAKTIKLLGEQLHSDRRNYRHQAIFALEASGETSAIDILLEFKKNEEKNSTLRKVDAAIKKLRGMSSTQKLQQRIEKLEKEQKQLRKKLDKDPEKKS